MKLQTLADCPALHNKKVLLRVDFNVPLSANGEVQDDSRISASLPTIQYLQEKGAKIILITHLGRPKGQYSDEYRLTNVAKKLSELLGKPLHKIDTVIGKEAEEATNKLQAGEILMLENVRCEPGEESCDEQFTSKLAQLGEIFVQDAFGTAHRKHASTYGLAQHLPAYAGLLMEKEIKALSPLLTTTPAKPLTMIFGGAKIDTKIGVIENFLDKADHILVGGGLANTFLYAEGKNIGGSLFEEDKKEIAQEIMKKCPGEKLQIPTDVVLAKEIGEKVATEIASTDDVSPEMKILDIGPATAEKFAQIIAKSATIIWNGPVGLYELTPFQHGSKVIAEAIANSSANSIVGGGDTADCIKRFEIPEEKFSHISTGGGACIEYLSGEKLPGIEVLYR